MKKVLACLLLLALAHQAAAQETRYVRDWLYVPVRSGPGTQYRIVHRGIKSGVQVRLSRTSESGEWAQITTPNGVEGWVQAQYLIAEAPARQQLEALREEHLRVQEENAQLKSYIETLEEGKELNAKDLREAEQRAQRLAEELAELKKIAANAIQLNENNKELVKENGLLRDQVDVLTSENLRLKDESDQEWFLNGVIAVGFGVALALLVPRLAPRRRQTEWK